MGDYRMKYGIQATITKEYHNDSYKEKCWTSMWTITKQIPFFYLDGEVQGILNEEHAKKIAKSILNPFDDDNSTVSVFAQVIKE